MDQKSEVLIWYNFIIIILFLEDHKHLLLSGIASE